MTGQNDILRKLIEFEVAVNQRDSAGYTPLHYACQNNFPATVRKLTLLTFINYQLTDPFCIFMLYLNI